MALILVAAVLAILFAREGLSQKSFDEIHAQDPSLNRLTWRINWLLFFALPPGLLALWGAATMLLR